MRTSLIDIQQAEQYLQGKMNAGDAAVFEARLLTDPVLKSNMGFQQRAYSVIRMFRRKYLQQVVREAHDHIFQSPEHADFRQQIHALFKK